MRRLLCFLVIGLMMNCAQALDPRDISPYDKYPECLDIRTDSSSGRCVINDGGFPRHVYAPPGPLAAPGNNLGAIGVVPPNATPGANAAPAPGANATAPAGSTLAPAAGSQTTMPDAVLNTTPGAAAGPAPGTGANLGGSAGTQNAAAGAGGVAREAAPRRR